ncbi:MAG: DUF924 domain-containing protein [Candidatus Omnitrophica bacterium]|nr:DUF924 domain-containing protein [Candidatus Omnitrophota bacterium]
MERIQRILDFWFEDLTDDKPVVPGQGAAKKWFKKSDDTDNEIRQKFEGDIIRARKRKYDAWMETPEGMLALIIVLDQFSRNVYRDTPKAFENDLKVLEYALMAIKKGFDKKVTMIQRQFIYMALMHAENLAVQKKCVECFEDLLEEAEEKKSPAAGYFKNNLSYASRHYDIIKRFNRFPHRNEILGRKSTAEEMEFLEQPGSSF